MTLPDHSAAAPTPGTSGVSPADRLRQLAAASRVEEVDPVIFDVPGLPAELNIGLALRVRHTTARDSDGRTVTLLFTAATEFVRIGRDSDGSLIERDWAQDVVDQWVATGNQPAPGTSLWPLFVHDLLGDLNLYGQATRTYTGTEPMSDVLAPAAELARTTTLASLADALWAPTISERMWRPTNPVMCDPETGAEFDLDWFLADVAPVVFSGDSGEVAATAYGAVKAAEDETGSDFNGLFLRLVDELIGESGLEDDPFDPANWSNPDSDEPSETGLTARAAFYGTLALVESRSPAAVEAWIILVLNGNAPTRDLLFACEAAVL